MDLTIPAARCERDQLATRTDVLDRVGVLATLPDDMHASADQVATFYETTREVIRQVVLRSKGEFDADGYRVLTRAEVSDELSLTPDELGMPRTAPSVSLFPRRAVLRVGMLLRDSPVARQVRDYLLDTERDARPELDLLDPDVALDKIIELASLAKTERAARIAAETESRALASRIQKDAPLVAKAEAHSVSDSVVHRQEFAREVMAWGAKVGVPVTQAHVMRFLGHIGLFIRGERTDTGHATADAIRRGLAFTDKGTAKNGHAWATGKLTTRGQDYAWKRITKFVDANGSLELPRELRGGDPA